MRALALLLVLSVAAPAWAQDTKIDATKLGVSLERIQKGLRVPESDDAASTGPLRLEFSVLVYGEAPRIDLLKDVDVLHGDAPNTAPTHQQVVAFLTPQMFRRGAPPLSALRWWADVQAWRKNRKCEKEIAGYRTLLMQGLDVPAPRCSQ